MTSDVTFLPRVLSFVTDAICVCMCCLCVVYVYLMYVCCVVLPHRLQETGDPGLLHIFVKVAVVASLDRRARERELVSALLASLHPQVTPAQWCSVWNVGACVVLVYLLNDDACGTWVTRFLLLLLLLLLLQLHVDTHTSLLLYAHVHMHMYACIRRC
jgi:hypothetical protein